MKIHNTVGSAPLGKGDVLATYKRREDSVTPIIFRSNIQALLHKCFIILALLMSAIAVFLAGYAGCNVSAILFLFVIVGK